ncbi:MAG: hypothetical protein KJ995_05530 [Candidatus Omnitrophica bacterium]|nr:hypothetical protein [Candidatus Omnitrophota bacterium]MBU1128350.1 hypothetical protein [Candidatus Omnitrophota bacterium]MBU1784770.1 hypothetical protein [Candidatus Omnitrophota bacterium]MBU1851847.1 hypothetical protein [Candidatus Omnitrophota bacterium]
MKVVSMMAAGILLVLVVLSSFLPPLPIWIGGLIGVAVFLGVGNLVARTME